MIKIRKIALATAALSLAATPAIAEATFERSAAPIQDESKVGGSSTLILSLLAAAAVVGGIIVVASDDNSVSP